MDHMDRVRLSDAGDRAQQATEDLTSFTISNIRSNVGRTLLHSGYCYYCDEKVRSPHLFCDLDCRDDWEREQKLKALAGRR
jgi:hypothetical protein